MKTRVNSIRKGRMGVSEIIIKNDNNFVIYIAQSTYTNNLMRFTIIIITMKLMKIET